MGLCPRDKCKHYGDPAKYGHKCFNVGPQCWKGYLDVFFGGFKYMMWKPNNPTRKQCNRRLDHNGGVFYCLRDAGHDPDEHLFELPDVDTRIEGGEDES